MSTTPSSPESLPTEDDARRIVNSALVGRVSRIERFPTGLHHVVFDVWLDDGRRCVARLTRPSQRAAFAGAVYWSDRLRPAGIPLPSILYSDVDGLEHGVPALILERLAGIDLGDTYLTLSLSQKRRLAQQIVAIQRRVGSFRQGPGYGYAVWYADTTLAPSWRAVLDAHLARSRSRIEAVGRVDPTVVDRVSGQLDAHDTYIESVQPVPFLDDTTTKNVIVEAGRLTGIVDVDRVCFGDPLRTPALTRMALLSLGYDTDYVDLWEAMLRPTPEQRRMLRIYTAMYCVDFLSEIGQPFNRDVPALVDDARVTHLLGLLDSLLTSGSE